MAMRALVLVAQSQVLQPTYPLTPPTFLPPFTISITPPNVCPLQLRSDGLVTEALLRTAMSNRFATTTRPCTLFSPHVMRVKMFLSFSFFAAKAPCCRR